MLNVTETAGAYLAQLLARAETPEDMAIRIVRGTTGDVLTLQFDRVQPDDTTFDHEDRTVLVFDTRIAQRLIGSTIDVRNAEEGPKLVIRR